MQYKQSVCFENQIPENDPIRKVKVLTDSVLNQMHLETHFNNESFPVQQDQPLKAHLLMSLLHVADFQEFARLLRENISLRWFLDLGDDPDLDFSSLNPQQLNLARASGFINQVYPKLAARNVHIW
jgi:transposase